MSSPQGTSPGSLLLGGRLDFIENRGQWDDPALFTASLGRNLSVSLESGDVALRLRGEPSADVRLLFEGASTGTTIVGEQQRRGVYNFFLGHDRGRWQSNVPVFGAVRYRGLYEGVDVHVLERNGRLEHPVLWVDPGSTAPPTIALTSLILNPASVWRLISHRYGNAERSCAKPRYGCVARHRFVRRIDAARH